MEGDPSQSAVELPPSKDRNHDTPDSIDEFVRPVRNHRLGTGRGDLRHKRQSNSHDGTDAKSEEVREITRKLETALARPAKELANEGLKLGAEILAELDHGSDLARLEQRETHLTQRLEMLRKSLAEKQAECKELKLELAARSNEIAEQYDDADIRDRLLRQLIDDIKPQLLERKSDMETLESEAKVIMSRLAELRVLTAERRFARDQSARSTRSTERRRNVSVSELEKKWSPLPKPLLTPSERIVRGRVTTKPNAPTANPLDQIKELADQ